MKARKKQLKPELWWRFINPLSKGHPWHFSLHIVHPCGRIEGFMCRHRNLTKGIWEDMEFSREDFVEHSDIWEFVTELEA